MAETVIVLRLNVFLPLLPGIQRPIGNLLSPLFGGDEHEKNSSCSVGSFIAFELL